jgi:hypothetical protein
MIFVSQDIVFRTVPTLVIADDICAVITLCAGIRSAYCRQRASVLI